MSNLRRLILFAVLVGLSGACGWWMSGRPEHGIMEGEEATAPLAFPHVLHAYDFAMECWECHEGVAEATDLSTSYTPVEDVCMDCHLREDDCSWCHPDPENIVFPPDEPSGLHFAHALHVESEEDCETCHTGAMMDEQLPIEMPEMDTCLGCHNHEVDYASGICNDCHPTLQGVPLDGVAEFNHTPDWIGTHGMVAVSQGRSCSQCHTESKCTECHSDVAPDMAVRFYPEALDRTVLHRGDWLNTHPIEAAAEPDMCFRCHTSNSCQDCHTAFGISGASANASSPHPAGWAGPSTPNFHGEEARLAIETCAVCHDQGASSNCVECHAVGRGGGNPHPPGWTTGWVEQNSPEDIAEATCQYCH